MVDPILQREDTCSPFVHLSIGSPPSTPIMSDWPANNLTRRINDTVYGVIYLPSPLEVIVDTCEFQRLRNLKQTALVNLVYPGCEHSRFVHSLGVFHLTHELMKKIRHDEPHLNITSSDHLCECIAALCHDIGHGPFSHTFDGPLARQLNRRWKHEEMSARIVDRILLDNRKVRNALEPYLGTGPEYENNVLFIKELITPEHWPEDTFVSDDLRQEENESRVKANWWAKGRPFEKSYLYDIVANTSNMHDVDKMDYLLRDSAASGVPISLNYDTITRLRDAVRVVKDQSTGVRHIGYNRKVIDDIKMIGDSRQDLHAKVYKHKTVLAAEKMLVEALVLSARHLEYEGSNGQMYSLDRIYEDVDAFLKTNDSIELEILISPKPELREAKNILIAMRERRFQKTLAHRMISPLKVEEIFSGNNYSPSPDSVRERIASEMKKHLGEEEMSTISVNTRELGKGFTLIHPIENQLFYDGKLSRHGVEPNGKYLDNECNETHFSAIPIKWEVFILGNPNASQNDRMRIDEALNEAVTSLQLITPRKRQAIDSPPNAPSASRRRLMLTNV